MPTDDSSAQKPAAADQKGALPQPQTKPLAGTVDVGDSGGTTLASVVAGDQLATVIHAAVAEIKGNVHEGDRVLLVNDRAVADSDIALAVVMSRIEQFDHLIAQFDWLTKPSSAAPQEPLVREEVLRQAANDLALVNLLPAAAVIAGAGAAAASGLLVPGIGLALTLPALAADFIGLFKTNYTIGSRTVSISAVALQAEVASQLTSDAKVTVELPGFALIGASTIFARFNDLMTKQFDLESRVAYVKAMRTDPIGEQVKDRQDEVTQLLAAFAKALGEQPANAAGLKEAIQAARTAIRRLSTREYERETAAVVAATGLIGAIDSFASSISTVAEGQAYSMLAAAALREHVRGAGTHPTHLLYVEVVSAGGEVVTAEHNFRDSKLGVVAGVQVAYLLSSAEGTFERGGLKSHIGGHSYDLDKLA